MEPQEASITQTASTSNVAGATQDGYVSGSYQGFSVDGNGIVEASFNNGQKEMIGQVAVATVAKPAGTAGNEQYRLSFHAGFGSRP